MFCPHLPVHSPDLQRPRHPWKGVAANAQAHPLARVGLAGWLTEVQTQVMIPSSPTSSATWIQSTRRSISLTSTTISCAQTTPPWFPPVQKLYRIQEHPAADCKQQPAEFPQCSDPVASGNRVHVVSGRTGLQEIGAELDRESVAATIFSSQSKRKRDRDTNVVHSLKDRENL